MEKIFEEEFLEAFLNEKLNIVEATWRRGFKNQEIGTQEFKNHLISFVKLLKKFSVKGFLVNAKEYHFTVPVDLQEWHDKEIIPEYIELGIEKSVFILPDDLFANVSINQTFEENEAQKINTQFVDSLEEARQIFKNK